MSEFAIHAEGLGKRYRIGAAQPRYKRFSETLMWGLLAPFRRLGNIGKPMTAENSIWAMKDVCLDVRAGEVVGIIGRNGAGKSTLLKILARITNPTEGFAELRGRVGSLLEVGTGFHPELTGRENVYLNGAILGMRRSEIERKFDEIVAFAELEKFLDTPVKRYSSGMYVRLAFAVAAHLDPEILFIDEVLAVGDKAFQEKCLDKMGDVVRGGRTILFVSHNMGAINRLCDRVILIEGGRIIEDGPAGEVVQSYLNRGSLTAARKTWPEDQRPGNAAMRLLSVTLKNAADLPVSEVNISEDAAIEIEFEVLRAGEKVGLSLVLFDANGYCVFSSLSNVSENSYHGRRLDRGRYVGVCRLGGDLLNNGRYHVTVSGAMEYWADSFRADHVISFDAVDDGVLKGDFYGNFSGVVRPRLAWTMNPVGE